MKKFNFNIAQVSFIKPILKELEFSGCSVEKLYRSTGLHSYKLNKSENYIPVPILYDVLNEICKQEEINNIASTFYDVLRVTSLASWGHMIVYAPTVLDACNLAKKYGNTILTGYFSQTMPLISVKLCHFENPCKSSMNYSVGKPYEGKLHSLSRVIGDTVWCRTY